MNFFLPISEKFSRITPGKEPKFTPLQYAEATITFGPGTKRGKQNLIYARWAIDVLKSKGIEKFDFLFSPKAKMTVLAELGRYEGSEIIVILAEKICGLRTKSKPAVEYLRSARALPRSRLSKSSPCAKGLARALNHAVQKYSLQHPTITEEMLKRALAQLRVQIIETKSPQ